MHCPRKVILLICVVLGAFVARVHAQVQVEISVFNLDCREDGREVSYQPVFVLTVKNDGDVPVKLPVAAISGPLCNGIELVDSDGETVGLIAGSDRPDTDDGVISIAPGEVFSCGVELSYGIALTPDDRGRTFTAHHRLFPDAKVSFFLDKQGKAIEVNHD